MLPGRIIFMKRIRWHRSFDPILEPLPLNVPLERWKKFSVLITDIMKIVSENLTCQFMSRLVLTSSCKQQISTFKKMIDFNQK